MHVFAWMCACGKKWRRKSKKIKLKELYVVVVHWGVAETRQRIEELRKKEPKEKTKKDIKKISDLKFSHSLSA